MLTIADLRRAMAILRYMPRRYCCPLAYYPPVPHEHVAHGPMVVQRDEYHALPGWARTWLRAMGGGLVLFT